MAFPTGAVGLSDNPDFENHWLSELFKAGGVSDAGIEIKVFKKDLMKVLDESGLDEAQREVVRQEQRAEEGNRTCLRQRSKPDVQNLFRLIQKSRKITE